MIPAELRKVLLVVCGSGVGGGARYWVSRWAVATFGPGFPVGTIAINALGSFLISFIMLISTRGMIGPEVRLALTTGLIGGFTTYSTFNYESLVLFERSGWALAALNVCVTVVLCLMMGVLGAWLGLQPKAP